MQNLNNNGNFKAIKDKDFIYFISEDTQLFDDKFTQLKKLAKSGGAEAQTGLAVLYFYGEEIEQSLLVDNFPSS